MQRFRSGKLAKGFTLLEILVVISILGVLASVVMPKVTKFIGTGKTEAYAAELKDVQSGVLTLLADAGTLQLDAATDTPTDDLATVTAGGGAKKLSDYVNGLNGTLTKTGCKYAFTLDGHVTQTPP